MRRLAVVGMGTAALIGVGPVTAGIGAEERRPSWCEDNAAAVAKVVGAGYVEVVLGAGATRDRPVQSAFACVEGDVGRRHQLDAIVTAWVDTQYGHAGWSCARQPSEAVTCKRRTVPLPGRASDHAGSPRNQWQIDLLNAGLAYDLQASGANAATRLEGECVRDVCTDDREYRAWARPGRAQPDQSQEAEGEGEADGDPDAQGEEEPGAGVQDARVGVPVGDIPAD